MFPHWESWFFESSYHRFLGSVYSAGVSIETESGWVERMKPRTLRFDRSVYRKLAKILSQQVNGARGFYFGIHYLPRVFEHGDRGNYQKLSARYGGTTCPSAIGHLVRQMDRMDSKLIQYEEIRGDCVNA